MEIECNHCKKVFKSDGNIGTKNRNHCPHCLYSQHLDTDKPGDRKSRCLGKMKPIDILFRKPRRDKYGKIKNGEAVILHECIKCGKKSTNRLAGDDSEERILKVFNSNKHTKEEKAELQKQLFGV